MEHNLNKKEQKTKIRQVRVAYCAQLLNEHPELTLSQIANIIGVTVSSISNYRKFIEKAELNGEPISPYIHMDFPSDMTDPEILLEYALREDELLKVEAEAEGRMDDEFAQNNRRQTQVEEILRDLVVNEEYVIN